MLFLFKVFAGIPFAAMSCTPVELIAGIVWVWRWEGCVSGKGIEAGIASRRGLSPRLHGYGR